MTKKLMYFVIVSIIFVAHGNLFAQTDPIPVLRADGYWTHTLYSLVVYHQKYATTRFDERGREIPEWHHAKYDSIRITKKELYEVIVFGESRNGKWRVVHPVVRKWLVQICSDKAVIIGAAKEQGWDVAAQGGLLTNDQFEVFWQKYVEKRPIPYEWTKLRLASAMFKDTVGAPIHVFDGTRPPKDWGNGNREHSFVADGPLATAYLFSDVCVNDWDSTTVKDIVKPKQSQRRMAQQKSGDTSSVSLRGGANGGGDIVININNTNTNNNGGAQAAQPAQFTGAVQPMYTNRTPVDVYYAPAFDMVYYPTGMVGVWQQVPYAQWCAGGFQWFLSGGFSVNFVRGCGGLNFQAFGTVLPPIANPWGSPCFPQNQLGWCNNGSWLAGSGNNIYIDQSITQIINNYGGNSNPGDTGPPSPGVPGLGDDPIRDPVSSGKVNVKQGAGKNGIRGNEGVFAGRSTKGAAVNTRPNQTASVSNGVFAERPVKTAFAGAQQGRNVTYSGGKPANVRPAPQSNAFAGAQQGRNVTYSGGKPANVRPAPQSNAFAGAQQGRNVTYSGGKPANVRPAPQSNAFAGAQQGRNVTYSGGKPANVRPAQKSNVYRNPVSYNAGRSMNYRSNSNRSFKSSPVRSNSFSRMSNPGRTVSASPMRRR